MTLLEIVLLSLAASPSLYIIVGFCIERFRNKREDKAKKIYQDELKRLRKTKG